MGKPADPMALMRMLGEPARSYPNERARFDDWLMAQSPANSQSATPTPAPAPAQEPMVYGWGTKRMPQSEWRGPSPQDIANRAVARTVDAPLPGEGGALGAGTQMAGLPFQGRITSGGGSSTTVRGLNVDPQARAQLEESLLLREQSIQAGAEAERTLSKEQVQAYGEADQRAKELESRLEARRSEMQSEYEKKKAEYDAAWQSAKQEKIDPDRWYSSRSTGQKVALGVASLLGGFLEGFTRGQIQNTAMRYIDQEIDRDLALQERSLEQKRQERGESLGILGDLVQRMGSVDAAKARARQGIAEDLTRRLAETAARVSDPIIKARMLEGLSAARETAAKSKIDLDQLTQDRVTSTYQSPQKVIEFGGGGGGGAAQGAGGAEPGAAKLTEGRGQQMDAAGAAMIKFDQYVKSVLESGRWSGYGAKAFEILPGFEAEATSIEAAYQKPLGSMMAMGTGAGNSNEAQEKYTKALPGFGMGQGAFKKRTQALTGQLIAPVQSALSTAEKSGRTKEAAALRAKLTELRQQQAAILQRIDAD